MEDAPATVVHVVSADLSRLAKMRLTQLCGATDVIGPQHVIQVGHGPQLSIGGYRPTRAHSPLEWAPLTRHALRRRVATGADATLLHAWTPTAARWCASLCDGGWPVIVEADLARPLSAQVHWPRSGRLRHAPWYVCPDDAADAGLRRCGVVDSKRITIGPGVPLRPRSQRDAARAAAGLHDNEIAVLPLPPYTRAGGAYFAAWSTMLVEKIRPDVRLLLPTGERELERAARLTASSQHEYMVRTVACAQELPALLAAADLAMLTPTARIPLDGLACAARAEVPLVAAATAQLRELLDGESPGGWLCQVRSPEDGARQLLHAIENPRLSQVHAQQARALADAHFSAERMRAAYHGLYAQILRDTRPSAVAPTP